MLLSTVEPPFTLIFLHLNTFFINVYVRMNLVKSSSFIFGILFGLTGKSQKL